MIEIHYTIICDCCEVARVKLKVPNATVLMQRLPTGWYAAAGNSGSTKRRVFACPPCCARHPLIGKTGFSWIRREVGVEPAPKVKTKVQRVVKVAPAIPGMNARIVNGIIVPG